MDINFDNWFQGALHSLLDQLWTLHVTHEALFDALERFTGFSSGTRFGSINNMVLIQDFRYVGNSIVGIYRNIEGILDVKDSRIIRHWYEFQ